MTTDIVRFAELDEKGHVETLELSSLSLKGETPYEILAEFPELQVINLGPTQRPAKAQRCSENKGSSTTTTSAKMWINQRLST